FRRVLFRSSPFSSRCNVEGDLSNRRENFGNSIQLHQRNPRPIDFFCFSQKNSLTPSGGTGAHWLPYEQSWIGGRPISLGKAFGLFRAAIAGLTTERTGKKYTKQLI